MSEPETPRSPWKKVPRPVRWLAVLAVAVVTLLVVLAIGLKVFTNRWIRPVVEEQASIAIPGDVTMGGLSVSLLGLNITVDDLAIRSDEPDAKPVIEVGKLSVSLARLPLFSRRLVVEDVEIENPVLHVVREQNGEINLLKVLVPETPELPVTDAPPSAPIPVLLRHLALGTGRIDFEDRAQHGAEVLPIQLPAMNIDNVVVTGDPGEDPSDAHLEVSAVGASIVVDGKFHRAADRLDVDATVDAKKLPLSRAWVYLPDLGWSELKGELDAKIHYVHVTGKKQQADGDVALRGLQVVVPRLKDPALSIESVAARIDALDLLGRRLALGQVTLEKPRVFFDPADRAHLPLLPKGLPGAGAPAPKDAPPPFAWSFKALALKDGEIVALGDEQQPLRIQVEIEKLASVATESSAVKIGLAQGDGSLALDGRLFVDPLGFNGKLTLDALALAPLLRALAGEQGTLVQGGVARGDLDLRLGTLAAGETPAPGGDLSVAGTFSLDGFDARSDADGTYLAKIAKLELTLEKVDVPGLLPPPGTSPEPAAAASSAPTPAVEEPSDSTAPAPAPAPAEPPTAPATTRSLRWDAPADAGSLRVKGKLAISGLGLKTGKGEPLSFDLKRFELGVKELELSRLLASNGPAPTTDAGSLRFAGALTLDGVAVRSGKEGEFGFELDRGEIGFKEVAAPGLLAPAGAKPREPMRIALDRARLVSPKLTLTRTDAGIVLPGETKTEPAPAAAAPPRIEVGSLSLEGGTVRFVDRTVKPFYQGDVTGLVLNARDLAFPNPRARDVSLKLDAPGPAPLWALGAYTPESSWYELNLDKLPLAPLNPYVRNASGYIVNGGELSLYSKGSVTHGQLYAANWITLFDPNLSGGGPDAPLEKAVGVPVSMALALLKDPSGNIGLSIPVDYSESGASVRLGSVIGSAVKQVLIGALTSPLKLLGAAVDTSGRVKDATPQSVGFLPGRIELAAGADERVSALAKLAATRPGMGLRLAGQTSGTDAQFLREAELAEALDSGEGLPEQARGLGQALLRRRLRVALETRLEGKPAELDPEDAEKLDAFLDAMEVGPDKLTDLAHRRVARVQELLRNEFGIEGGQFKQSEPGPPGGSPDPSVDVAVGS